MHLKSKLPKIGERVEKGARFVPRVDKLLDVGCGDGVITYFVNNKVKEIYGIDNSKIRLAKAKKLGIHAKLVNLDTQKIPYKANFFDAITCLDVIEHVYDPQRLANELSRVLKKKGRLILSTPNIRFSDHLYSLIFKGIFPKTSLDSELYDGGHIHFFTYKDIHLLLINAGFSKIVDEEIINKNRRGWKGQLVRMILGKKLMREFRTPGILVIAEK